MDAVSFPPKYPARFTPGDRVAICLGAFRGHIVTIKEVQTGWPYANYLVEHPTEGEFSLGERELGLTKETGVGAAATPEGREAERIARRRARGHAEGEEPDDGEGEAEGGDGAYAV